MAAGNFRRLLTYYSRVWAGCQAKKSLFRKIILGTASGTKREQKFRRLHAFSIAEAGGFVKEKICVGRKKEAGQASLFSAILGSDRKLSSHDNYMAGVSYIP